MPSGNSLPVSYCLAEMPSVPSENLTRTIARASIAGLTVLPIIERGGEIAEQRAIDEICAPPAVELASAAAIASGGRERRRGWRCREAELAADIGEARALRCGTAVGRTLGSIESICFVSPARTRKTLPDPLPRPPRRTGAIHPAPCWRPSISRPCSVADRPGQHPTQSASRGTGEYDRCANANDACRNDDPGQAVNYVAVADERMPNCFAALEGGWPAGGQALARTICSASSRHCRKGGSAFLAHCSNRRPPRN